MRIIAGEFRGRRIDAPEGQATRPMLDRVREALFSTLGERVEGARVLDLFGGSGSLGLEALSRGAAHVRFVEKAAHAGASLRANVEALGVGDRARIVRGDALTSRSWGVLDGERYDLVFLDPPYPLVVDPNGRGRVLEAIVELFAGATNPGATLVLHVPSREERTLRLRAPLVCEIRTYGTSALAYVTRTEAPPAAPSSADA